MGLPVIAVDFDDVTAGFNLAFSTFMNRMIGTNIAFEAINTFDMVALYGLEEKVLMDHVRHFLHHEHHTIEPIPFAVKSLRTMRRRFDPQMVTSRCESLTDITSGWIAEHAVGAFSALHFTNGFGTKFPERKRTKTEVCQAIGARVLVDDHVGNAIEVSKAGIPVLLFDRPWNRGYEASGVVRVDSWHRVMEWVYTNIQ